MAGDRRYKRAGRIFPAHLTFSANMTPGHWRRTRMASGAKNARVAEVDSAELLASERHRGRRWRERRRRWMKGRKRSNNTNEREGQLYRHCPTFSHLVADTNAKCVADSIVLYSFSVKVETVYPPWHRLA
jgi:hypothetical protein